MPFEPQVAQTNAQVAHYSFGTLSPGTYHVYAVSDLEGLEYANPEAMRGIPSQSWFSTAPIGH
jgi:uncharacterized protein (DUF2141 family)